MAGKDQQGVVHGIGFTWAQQFTQSIELDAERVLYLFRRLEVIYNQWEERTRDLSLPFYDLNFDGDRQFQIGGALRWVWRKPPLADGTRVLHLQPVNRNQPVRVVLIRPDGGVFRLDQGQLFPVLTVQGQPLLLQPNQRIYFADAHLHRVLKAILDRPFVHEAGQILLDKLGALRNYIAYLIQKTNLFAWEIHQHNVLNDPNLDAHHDPLNPQLTPNQLNLERALRLYLRAKLREMDLDIRNLMQSIVNRNNHLRTLRIQLPFAANIDLL